MDDVHLSNSIESVITQFPPHNLITRFPVKLWRIVNSCTSGSISWSKDGKSIKIHKRLFEAEFLKDPSSPFKTESFNSFIRQLNLYGFQKVIHRDRYLNHDHQTFFSEFQEYRNQNFRKGFPEMIPYVQRRARIKKESQEEYAERFSRLINPPISDKNAQIQTDVINQTFKQYRPDIKFVKTLDSDFEISLVQNCGDNNASSMEYLQTDSDIRSVKTDLSMCSNELEGLGDASEQVQNSNISFIDFLTSDIDTQQLVIKYDNDVTDALGDDLSLQDTMESGSKGIPPAIQEVLIGSESTNHNLQMKDLHSVPINADGVHNESFYIIGQNNDSVMSAYPLQMDDKGQIYVKIPVTLPNTKCIKNVNLDLSSCNIEFQTTV